MNDKQNEKTQNSGKSGFVGYLFKNFTNAVFQSDIVDDIGESVTNKVIDKMDNSPTCRSIVRAYSSLTDYPRTNALIACSYSAGFTAANKFTNEFTAAKPNMAVLKRSCLAASVSLICISFAYSYKESQLSELDYSSKKYKNSWVGRLPNQVDEGRSMG